MASRGYPISVRGSCNGERGSDGCWQRGDRARNGSCMEMGSDRIMDLKVMWKV